MHFLVILLVSLSCFSTEYKLDEDTAKFSARITRLNKSAKLMRLKISFENAKFLRKSDRIEFWNETYPNKKCMSYVLGRSAEYLLVKVPKYNECIHNMHLTTGTYLHLYSEDLEKGIKIGKGLVEILIKKKFALQSKMKRYKNELNSHIEKVELVSKRYQVLREKLDLELKEQLAALEEDKVKNFQNFNGTKAKLDDLMFKLEQYRVYDQNLTEDRWSLDPKLYFKK
ncbi:MAG: hypothetical protein N4A33_13150 [Bacteriovoracaceae bacterium]|jgi:hypothetical protein|nr:hypothetical protein [Bacteriovoracaceae bacterium]